MKDSLAEEWKASPAIPLSFDQFELGHVPFDHPVIDRPSEAISHRVFVFLNTSSKGLEFGQVALFHLGEPGIKETSGTCAYHLGKLLNQVIGLLNFWIDLTELGQRFLLFNPEFFRTTKKEEGRLSWSCKGRRLW
jgi:hypothetical protein